MHSHYLGSGVHAFYFNVKSLKTWDWQTCCILFSQTPTQVPARVELESTLLRSLCKFRLEPMDFNLLHSDYGQTLMDFHVQPFTILVQLLFVTLSRALHHIGRDGVKPSSQYDNRLSFRFVTYCHFRQFVNTCPLMKRNEMVE